jgi:hypothetical protein
MIEVRLDPEPGVAFVADYLYPYAAREETVIMTPPAANY